MVEQRTNNLVFVVNNLPPYRTHFLERLASRLPEYRIAVVVTGVRLSQPWEVREPEGVTVMWISRSDAGTLRRPGDAWAAWQVGEQILSILRTMGPAAVVVHGYNDPAHMRVIRGCHRAGVLVILRGDSNIRSEERKSAHLRIAKRWALRLGFRYVDAFMPVGSNGKAYFLHYGAPDERIFIVPLEPLYRLFETTPSATEVQQFQTDHGLEPSRHRIIYVGRLVPGKRVDILIEAFARVAEARPTWDLLIAGDGPSRRSLEALVPDALRDRVIWTGFLTPEQLRLGYASSSVFVLPSESEPWGLVVNEAIAAGLAPIVSDAVGAAADLIPDSDAGWVFPTNDAEGLATALLEATEGEGAAIRASNAYGRLQTFRESYDSAEQIRLAIETVSSVLE